MLFQNKKAELPIFRRVDFHYPVDKRLNQSQQLYFQQCSRKL